MPIATAFRGGPSRAVTAKDLTPGERWMSGLCFVFEDYSEFLICMSSPSVIPRDDWG